MGLCASSQGCPLLFCSAQGLVIPRVDVSSVSPVHRGDAKITDFGISATVENTLANVKTYVGTSAYMRWVPPSVCLPHMSPSPLSAAPLPLLLAAWGILASPPNSDCWHPHALRHVLIRCLRPASHFAARSG